MFQRNATRQHQWLKQNLVQEVHSVSRHFVYEYTDWKSFSIKEHSQLNWTHSAAVNSCNVRTKIISNHSNIKLLQISALIQTVISTKANIPPTITDRTIQSAPMQSCYFNKSRWSLTRIQLSSLGTTRLMKVTKPPWPPLPLPPPSPPQHDLHHTMPTTTTSATTNMNHHKPKEPARLCKRFNGSVRLQKI